MRLIVTGARDFTNQNRIWTEISRLHPTTVVQGGAAGVDEEAKQWAIANDVNYETFQANWRVEHRAAGPIRNQRMVDAGADLVLAFLRPDSRGTADCVRRARAAGIPVIEVLLPPS